MGTQTVAAAEGERSKGHITASWLSYQVGQTLDPDTIIVNELVNTSGFNRTKPGTQFNSGGSSLGWAGPAAIGAKVAAPDKTVIAVTGDASFGMVGMEVETAARHQIAILTVMLNKRNALHQVPGRVSANGKLRE